MKTNKVKHTHKHTLVPSWACQDLWRNQSITVTVRVHSVKMCYSMSAFEGILWIVTHLTQPIKGTSTKDMRNKEMERVWLLQVFFSSHRLLITGNMGKKRFQCLE